MLQKQKATWRGIRRHGAGWQAEVRVTGHPRSVQAFPLDTTATVMQAWRTAEKRRLRALAPHAATGTFAHRVKDYLRARAAMIGITERARQMDLWIAEFGTRTTDTIKPWEIAAVRDRWLTEGPQLAWRRWSADHDPRRGGRWVEIAKPLSPSSVNKRLRALENFYTVMDGRHAANPVREVTEADEPESAARGLPYDVVEAILAKLPDRGRPDGTGTRPVRSLTKIRLTVIAYTGLSHGELMRLAPGDVDLETGWMHVTGRRKGKRSKSSVRPLTSYGLAAVRAFAAAEAWGQFSPSGMWKTFQRACAKLEITGLRPYDLRHSYASEVFEKTGDLKTTQLMLGHASASTSLRYAKRALSPVLAAAVEKIRAAGGFAAPAIAPAAPPSTNDTTSR